VIFLFVWTRSNSNIETQMEPGWYVVNDYSRKILCGPFETLEELKEENYALDQNTLFHVDKEYDGEEGQMCSGCRRNVLDYIQCHGVKLGICSRIYCMRCVANGEDEYVFENCTNCKRMFCYKCKIRKMSCSICKDGDD